MLGGNIWKRKRLDVVCGAGYSFFRTVRFKMLLNFQTAAQGLVVSHAGEHSPLRPLLSTLGPLLFGRMGQCVS